MVISLLAGLGIGIKIGENNESNSATPVAKTKPTPTTKPKTFTRPKNPLVGTIVGKTPQLLVVAGRSGRVTMRVIPKTLIHVTAAATPADIKVGSHVLFVLKLPHAAPLPRRHRRASRRARRPATTTTTQPGPLTAKEVIIVTGTRKARAGLVVSSVTADSMTFAFPKGRVTGFTTGAKIVKTIPGKPVKPRGGEARRDPVVPPAAREEGEEGRQGRAASACGIALENRGAARRDRLRLAASRAQRMYPFWERVVWPILQTDPRRIASSRSARCAARRRRSCWSGSDPRPSCT